MLALKARNQFNPYKYVIFAGVLVLASFAHSPASAEDLDQKGYDVAARNDRSDRGFNNSRVELEMVLKNASGAESRRVLEQSTLELPDESVGPLERAAGPVAARRAGGRTGAALPGGPAARGPGEPGLAQPPCSAGFRSRRTGAIPPRRRR